MLALFPGHALLILVMTSFVCFDKRQQKIDALKRREIPIFEPELHY